MCQILVRVHLHLFELKFDVILWANIKDQPADKLSGLQIYDQDVICLNDELSVPTIMSVEKADESKTWRRKLSYHKIRR